MRRAETTRTSYRATFLVLVAAVTAFSLIQSLIIPVLAPLAVQLDTDRTTVTWLFTAYLLSASVFTPSAGRLGDIWGKDRILVASLLVLALGCLISALAPNVGWMIAGRAVQGAGGGVMAVSFGIIRDELPEDKVPMAIGFISSLLAVGIGIGIIAAGPIVDLLGYSWLFWLPCIVGVLAALVAALIVPASPTRTRERISIMPAVLLAGWLVTLLLGVSQAPSWGWTSPRVAGLVGAAVVLSVAWVRAESKARVPLVDMQLMRRRPVWTSNVVALLLGFGLYASSAFIPQLVQTPPELGYGFGASVTESGLIMLPSSLVSFAAGLLAASGARRFGGKALVVLGCLLGAVGMTMMALAHGSEWQVYLASGLFGGGIGLTMACVANLVVASVPAAQTGVASGMNANIRTIGGSIGSAVLASIVTLHADANGVPAESGYVAGFLLIAAMLVVGAVVGTLIPTVRRPDTEIRVPAGSGVDDLAAVR